MIVSSKGRYALRVMLVLAQRQEQGFIPLKEIAADQEISQKYLESIMTVLSKGGLVEATHGKNGGYRLNRRVEEYTIGQILRLTEGDLKAVSCDADCQRHCPSRNMWNRLDRMVDEFFEGITLKDLIDEE